MKRTSLAPSGVGWVAGLAVAVACALLLATVAQAQSFKDQYGDPEAPSGDMSGMSCTFVQIQSEDGSFNAGDVVEYPGDFSVSDGASVVIDDSDGTLGTFIDGRNAEISETSDGVRIAATGDPINVSGGDGVLGNMVCDSLVASTGIFGDPSGKDDGGILGLSVLPDTGGAAILVYLGALSIAGGGLVLLRHRALRLRRR